MSSQFLVSAPSSVALLAAVVLVATQVSAATPVGCASLSTLHLPDTTIGLAEEVPGPSFTPPGSAPRNNLPAFCRVVGITRPQVKFEVWLPLTNWNGKFQGVGNGGTAGFISYSDMAEALTHGYATASTDTGHTNTPPGNAFDFTWALGGTPELVEDFGHRGLHVTTVNAKQITRAFYGKPPKHSYFVGCSKGGQQALVEAQRYPEDYDGLIAGAPANNWTRFYAGVHLWYSIATLKDPDSYIPASKVSILGDAVNAACDAIDGIVDGVLDDPRKCQFDPAVLACKQDQDPNSCYTAKQVKAIKDIWAGAHNSDGQLVHPSVVPGGESGPWNWATWITGSDRFKGVHWLAADAFFRYMVFDPSFKPLDFNYDTDLPAALAKVGHSLDAVDPDLRSFKRRGGKLIVYHGFSDADIPPLNTINYYESVVSFLKKRGQSHDEAAAETGRFLRLFMVPGMQHCGGGPGPNKFDMLTALENWVEKGQAPKQVIASHATKGVVDRTRPLCPYPDVAVHIGVGSTDDAANFVCRKPSDTEGHHAR